MDDERWPFDDPPNVATITTRKVMSGEHVVDYVTHDQDDGGWQFLSRQAAGPDTKEAMLVGLANIVSKDPSLAELADLPLGWCAWRRGRGEPWVRARNAH
ncbi:MAG TPA: hypothetical protein VFE03_03815 [Caulobacteraceae bacterium]|jgi:hypothetical protein|nr:hypothetical protein [Caulobacteraceae bacterium]